MRGQVLARCTTVCIIVLHGPWDLETCFFENDLLCSAAQPSNSSICALHRHRLLTDAYTWWRLNSACCCPSCWTIVDSTRLYSWYYFSYAVEPSSRTCSGPPPLLPLRVIWGWLGTTISYDSNKVSIDGSIHSSQHHWNEVEKEEEEERIEN